MNRRGVMCHVAEGGAKMAPVITKLSELRLDFDSGLDFASMRVGILPR
jgi:hypothetical protein